MSAFAKTFELAGCRHVRCDKPTAALVGTKHVEMQVPAVGKTHLDVYADFAAQQVYIRLYRMSDGEVAWYRATITPGAA